MGAIFSMLSASGDAFRGRLTVSDVQQVGTARQLFLTTALLPGALYYLGFSPDGRRPKFPATISFTIRAGLPKIVHHIIWLAGWYVPWVY
jgi:hypothetical protein